MERVIEITTGAAEATKQLEPWLKPKENLLLARTEDILQKTATRLYETGVMTRTLEQKRFSPNPVTQKFLALFDVTPREINLTVLKEAVINDPKLQDLISRLVESFKTFRKTVQGPDFFSSLKLDKKTSLLAKAALVVAPFVLNDVLPRRNYTSDQEVLASMVLLAALIGRTKVRTDGTLPPNIDMPPSSSGGDKESLPKSIVLPQSKKENVFSRNRQLIISTSLAILIGCSVITGSILIGKGEKEQQVNAPTPTTMPYEQRQINRAKDTYDFYQKNPETYDPTSLTPAIEEQLIPYSWDWWFIKDPNQLSKAFQGKVDRSDIDLLAADPEYFYTILDKMKTKAELSGNKQEADRIQKLKDLYKKREEFKGTPEQFLNQTSGSFLTPDIEKQQALEAINRLKSIGEIPFGRTGLSKREVLKRQGYYKV